MEISLNFSLVDMRNDRIISYGDIPKSRFSINTEEVNQLSSSMATSVYRVPLEDFGRIKKDLVGYLGYSNLIYLTVNNIKSVEDLFNLSNTLKMKGVTYQVNPRIFSLSPNKGVLQLEFSGTQAEAEQFLRGMAKEKFLDGRNFIFEEDNGDYSLAIKSSGVKKAEDDQGESLENKKRVVL
jgi:hypothetical protein